MSKKSLHENGSPVKRKRRTIPDGFRLTITEVRGFPRRTRGPDRNLLSKIKPRYIEYIGACPYLNSNEKLVLIKIAEWFNLRDGFTRAAYVTLAESVGVSIPTVKRAIRTGYDAGLLAVKTGGPSRKGSFGPVANKYVPAFRLVINSANNLLIKNAPYHFLPRNVNGEAKSLGQKSLGQIDPIVETLSVNVEAKSLGQIDPVHANVGGAQAAPPPTSGDGSATRPEDNPKNENTKPADSDYSQPTIHQSSVKNILSYVCHTLAEWDAILSPNSPDRGLVTGYVAGTLSPVMAEAVEFGILKKYKAACKHSPDLAPFDNLPENAVRLYCPENDGEGLERGNPPKEKLGPDTPLFVYSIY